MEYLLIQTILAFNEGDDTGWMQLLVIVILVALYGLVNINKTKRADESEKERGFELQKTAGKAPAERFWEKIKTKVKTRRFIVINNVPPKRCKEPKVKVLPVCRTGQKTTIPESQQVADTTPQEVGVPSEMQSLK